MKIKFISKEQIFTSVSIVFAIVVILYYFLTFIIFKENSVIAIFDYLNDGVPQFKMFHDEKLFFKFDAPTKCFEEMSTLYYMNINYSFKFMLYAFMDTFWAIILIRCLAIIFGFFSMYLLLRKCFSCPVYISILVSLCFSVSIPPEACMECIAYNTIPFIAYVFYYFSIKCKIKFSIKSVFLFLFPFFSNFTLFGLYICLFWFLGLIFQSIKNKKINYNLLVGFISLCIGYVLVDIKLFYVLFILKTPLNRDIPYFNLQSFPYSLDRNIKNFCVWFNYYLNYEYKWSKILTIFIIPLAVIIVLIFKYYGKHNSKQINNLIETDKKVNIVIFIVLFHLSMVFIVTLYTMFYIPISEHLPIITRYNITRVLYFARVYLFVVFALCLEKVCYISRIIYIKIFHEITENQENEISILTFVIISFLIMSQVFYIYYYSDVYKTWRNYKIIATNEIRIEATYKEFYGEGLFNGIKQRISYADEKVVAYGFWPGVLMYNGFSCIDGYNNSYPLSYMNKFKELINPMLILDDKAVNWFNYWGGEMFIFNPSWDMYRIPLLDRANLYEHNLQVDMDVLRGKFGVKYILSAYPFENANDIGLSLKGIYTQKGSIYTIYLYDAG